MSVRSATSTQQQVAQRAQQQAALKRQLDPKVPLIVTNTMQKIATKFSFAFVSSSCVIGQEGVENVSIRDRDNGEMRFICAYKPTILKKLIISQEMINKIRNSNNPKIKYLFNQSVNTIANLAVSNQNFKPLSKAILENLINQNPTPEALEKYKVCFSINSIKRALFAVCSLESGNSHEENLKRSAIVASAVITTIKTTSSIYLLKFIKSPK